MESTSGTLLASLRLRRRRPSALRCYSGRTEHTVIIGLGKSSKFQWSWWGFQTENENMVFCMRFFFFLAWFLVCTHPLLASPVFFNTKAFGCVWSVFLKCSLLFLGLFSLFPLLLWIKFPLLANPTSAQEFKRRAVFLKYKYSPCTD